MTKYIDADAVLHAIEGMREAEWAKQKYFIPNDISAKAILDAVEDTVNYEIPAANVTPVRHGEWLNANHTLIVTCSLCGGTVPTNWRGFYCQNCGAKMDGGYKNATGDN